MSSGPLQLKEAGVIGAMGDPTERRSEALKEEHGTLNGGLPFLINAYFVKVKKL